MFVKLVRLNEDNEQKELVVDLNEIAFVSETKPHINYDNVIEYEETTDEDTGIVTKVPTKWEEQPRYVIAFKNGRHPQFLDKDNYEQLINILLNNK